MSGGPRKRIKYGDKKYRPHFTGGCPATFALEQRHDNWSNTM